MQIRYHAVVGAPLHELHCSPAVTYSIVQGGRVMKGDACAKVKFGESVISEVLFGTVPVKGLSSHSK